MRTYTPDAFWALPATVALLLIATTTQAAPFIATGSMNSGRTGHAATFLPNGKVLVAGSDGNATELYNPATGTWATSAPTATLRLSQATATLLPNGKVLLVGGVSIPQHFSLAGAELYDPVTGTWTNTGSLGSGRYAHTATLLTNGKVLVTGGFNTGNGALNTSELYDPATGTWSPTTGSLTTGREVHTATLLPNGKVLVAGGEDNLGHSITSVELFDPATGNWTTLNSLAAARLGHSATLLPNGKVLVVGGYNITTVTWLASAELFDPVAGTWSSAGSLSTPRDIHAATLLANGKVLVTGGESTGLSFLASAELYDPAVNTWSAAGSMSAMRSSHTATLLPGGRVLIAGGSNTGSGLASSELYDSASGTWTATGALNIPDGVVVTTTVLPNGRALVVGDNTATLHDPTNGSWTATGPMIDYRILHHTATLLPNGKVLVTGGWGLSSAELYNPGSGTWTTTGSLTTNRYLHTTVLLSNGKVLALGGIDTNGNYLTTSEVYDPATGIWTATGTLSPGRAYAQAVSLPSGKVLVAGGYYSPFGGPISDAQLFDPATGNWTITSPMVAVRYYHSLTLLPNGKVLVAGGATIFASNRAELYDPVAQTWSLMGSLMNNGHSGHTATLLLDGKVLIAGGDSTGNAAEYYDPATGLWIATAPFTAYRNSFSASLLPNGKVLVAGGVNSSSSPNSADLFDPGWGFGASSQPQITTATSPLSTSNSLVLTGSRFRGLSGSSGGNDHDSPTDYPVVQLRSLENGQTLFLSAASWSTNSFTSGPVSGFPSGYAFATVFVNGIPGRSAIILVSDPIPATVTLGNLSPTYDGFAKPVSVITTPPGLTVNVTYNGSANAPTNAGSYTVIGTINDSLYQGAATNTLVISPAAATVTLGNLLQSYDGTARNASVVTTPPGLTVNLTYNASANAPTNAGSYTVVGIIADPNYQGSASGTLVVVTGITVNTAQTLRAVDARWFGVNTAAWDGYLDTPDTVSALAELGTRILRWPGGSWGDIYHESAPPNSGWGSYTTNFIHIVTNAHAQAFMIANYGTGTTNEAADWVRLCNVTNQANFKYWEVGNECYGSWEADNNTNAPFFAHDGWTYAMRFKDYYTAMKAVDPSIKVGIMLVPSEDSYFSPTTYVFNPRTGFPHFGWSAVLLDTLRSLGITPDFAVHHVYPEYQNDNDATLLQAAANWAPDATILRQMITDYMGPAGTNIELVCTENNADAGSQGRQSTSVVDALYLADSLSRIMKTEFNAFLWWDLRNGPDTGGDFNPSLYGWRTEGDLGIIRDLNTRYPTFYAMKLMPYFAQPGDTILNAGSSDNLLSVYAAQKLNGAVSVLVINKDRTNTLTRPVALAGYVPHSLATIRSYGIPQDEATRTNSIVPGAQDIATNLFSSTGTNFNFAFPPYSLTLFTLAPAAPSLGTPQFSNQPSNTFVFQLQGQTGARYVLQTSSNLVQWIPALTNVLAGPTVTITNPIPPGTPRNFWRAIWQP